MESRFELKTFNSDTMLNYHSSQTLKLIARSKINYLINTLTIGDIYIYIYRLDRCDPGLNMIFHFIRYVIPPCYMHMRLWNVLEYGKINHRRMVFFFFFFFFSLKFALYFTS